MWFLLQQSNSSMPFSSRTKVSFTSPMAPMASLPREGLPVVGNDKSSATITTSNAAGQSLPMKNHRWLGFMVPTKSSNARANLLTNGTLKPTFGALTQPKSFSLDKDKVEANSIKFDLSENTYKSPPLTLVHLKASFWNPTGQGENYIPTSKRCL